MRNGIRDKALKRKPEPSDEANLVWVTSGRSARNGALLCLLVLAPGGATAQDLANLVYLGTDRTGTNSFFLSKVSFGFDLTLLGGPSNIEVDRFSFVDGSGLHLSISPIVAPGEAGRHTLFENAQGSPYELDSTLQTGGINPPTSGGGGGGGGGGGSSGGDIEQALFGFGQSPVFLSPYSISDRLVGASLGKGVARSDGNASPSPSWIEGGGFSASDDFAGRDGDGQRFELQFGLDLISRSDIKIGLAGGIETASHDTLGGKVSSSYDGSYIGPYIAWMPRADLVLDAWFGYAARSFDAELLGSTTEFDVSRWFVSANATAEMPAGDFALRPKLGIFYSSDRAGAHDFVIDGRTLSVGAWEDEVILTSLSTELRRAVPDGSADAVPYLLGGIDYYVERPNNGRVFDGSLELQDSSDWLGKVELGLTWPMGDDGLLDASLAYSGNDETDVLAAQLRAEVKF
jgi:hypothetical protein